MCNHNVNIFVKINIASPACGMFHEWATFVPPWFFSTDWLMVVMMKMKKMKLMLIDDNNYTLLRAYHISGILSHVIFTRTIWTSANITPTYRWEISGSGRLGCSRSHCRWVAETGFRLRFAWLQRPLTLLEQVTPLYRRGWFLSCSQGWISHLDSKKQNETKQNTAQTGSLTKTIFIFLCHVSVPFQAFLWRLEVQSCL